MYLSNTVFIFRIKWNCISNVSEIKDLFKLFDQDDSGSVSYDELAKIVRGLGQNPTEKELEEMFKQLDDDGMRI